jgi:hypothetical protein
MRRILKIGLIGLVVLLIVVTAGFLVWTQATRYQPFPEAAALITPDVKTPQGWYVFKAAQPTTQGFIFYPGGLVDAAAYAPLMKAIADQGITAVIAPMPLDLAVFGIGKANDVIAAYPEITTWIIGGHSLGGSMAAQYVKDNPTKVKGVVFMAAYPADNVDLSQLPIKFVMLYGTYDGVARNVFKDSLARLPADTQLIAIDGGNHAQFGNYGPQAGDGTATMSRDEQQARTVEAIVELMQRIGQ